MRRGDLVLVAAPGDYGKPRPALVVQSDAINPTHSSVAVCLVTSSLRADSLFRLTVQAGPDTGLSRTSQIMVDKIVALPREKIGHVIGHVDRETMARFDRAFAVIYGIAD